MDFKTVIAKEDDNGRRLDRIIRKYLSDENISVLYKSIRKGLIKLNGKKTTPEVHVIQGDEITIASFLIKEQSVEQKPIVKNTSLKIDKIFENENILVVNKPTGIAVHGESSLESQLKYELQTTSSLSFTPGPLHRLDKNTSGLIAFSKSLIGAKWFSNAISTHEIRKFYLGIIEGRLEKELSWTNVIIQEEKEKDAQTTVKPVAYGNYMGKDVSLCLFEISTGRKHQIRIHSSINGFPLLGDKQYGSTYFSNTGNPSKTNYYLHAYKMLIPTNPIGLPNQLIAKLPEEFERILNNLLINCNLQNII